MKILTAIIIMLVVIGSLVFTALIPYFEAKTFNSCTQSNATYIDAVFTQLRATECKK